MGPKPVGAFGEVHPKVLKALDVKGPLVAFEITLDALPPRKARPTKMKPKLQLSEFQPVTRDFAFVVGRDVAAGDILKAAQAAERQLIAEIDVFDVYEGAGIDPDKKWRRWRRRRERCCAHDHGAHLRFAERLLKHSGRPLRKS